MSSHHAAAASTAEPAAQSAREQGQQSQQQQPVGGLDAKRQGHAKKASEVSVVSGRTVYSESDSDDELSVSYMTGPGRLQLLPQHQQQQLQKQQEQQQHHGKQKKRKSPSAGWDILTSAAALDPAQPAPRAPAKCEGYLFKRRRFPLKGWHKRWYVCDKGFFYYAKSATEMKSLGRYHGNIDLGNSFISYKRSRRRIHIDAGSIVHHVRCKRNEDFETWIGQLNTHRTYRHLQLQSQPLAPPPMQLFPPNSMAAAAAAVAAAAASGGGTDVTDSPAVASMVPLSPAESVKLKSLTIARTGSLTRGCLPPGARVVGPVAVGSTVGPPQLISGVGLSATLQRLRDPAAAVDDAVSAKLQRLQGLVTDIEAMLDSCSKFSDNGKGKANSTNTSLGSGNGGGGVALREPPSIGGGGGVGGGLQQSSSNPNLTAEQLLAPSSAKVKQRHSALEATTSGSAAGFEAKDLADTLAVFLMKATTAAELIKAAGADLDSERQRLLTQGGGAGCVVGSGAGSMTTEEVARLSAQVTELGRQNQELRQRLSVIHGHSDLSAVVLGAAVPQALLPDAAVANISSSLSRDSITEYHDAAERLSLDLTSSESEDELTDEDEDANATTVPGGGASSAGGDKSSSGGGGSGEAGSDGVENDGPALPVVATTGRREVLPVPQPDAGNLSLFNILCRNIGKDLSSVRMPIASNEPLNALQRLCEELEYSGLLDQAAEVKDPMERLVLVVAFAVSAYASTASRSAKKPFNPLLGETFECVREDKGWRYVAEQVSHHPAVAACHCDSPAWELWQDCRLRNKFWGKSLEAQPLGAVHWRLKATGEHFQWNKVTTCIYNLFSSSRYIDHYGELTVQGPNGSQARLTFHKGGSVSGLCRAGGRETAVFGRWCESLFAGREHTARCVWRSGALPPHSSSYYGFTRFAIELNELQDSLVSVLPVTDTRFRPDQRLLEVGDLDSAENQKLRLEAKQRTRPAPVQPRWFRQAADKSWEFGHEYWKAREAKFADIELPDLFD